MPLVASNTVSRWYRKDSWVYRNFTYLFKNQLWNTNVPSGFSLCPYFWLALFAMTFFRLFVGGILLIRLLFKPFGNLLEKTDRFFIDHFGAKESVTGIPTFTSTIVGTFLSAFLFIIVKGVASALVSYASVGALPALFIPATLFVIAIVCWSYYSATKHQSDRCKVEYYLRIVTLLAIGAAYFVMPSEFVAVITFASAFVWHITTVVLHFIFVTCIWKALYFIGSCFKWFVIGFLNHLVLFGLCLLGGVIASAVGYFASGFVLLSNTYDSVQENRKLRLRAENVLKIFGNATYRYDNGYRSQTRSKEFWYDYMYNVPEAVAIAYEIARKGTVDSVSESAITRAVEAALNTFKLELEYKKAEKEKLSKRCTEWTNVAGKAFTHISYPITSVFSAIRWLFRETWTFFCLIFQLAKAKKQGACPYLKFTDAEVK